MTRKPHRPPPAAVVAVPPPRLAMDAWTAAVIVTVFGWAVSASLTPDGVAYLENAELIASGQVWQALQGYWSPGYSLLLVPAVWIARGDRSVLLALAHCVQIALALTAIWLATIAVRRRIPAAVQRAVLWLCIWVVVRWLTQELLTPDLLLGALVLAFLARAPAATLRDAVLLGVVVGLAFLAKTSIWPSLAVAACAVVMRYWRAPTWPRFVTVTTAVAMSIASVFVIPLSMKAGRFTLGGVGALNAVWYLGDLNQRTPDSDQRRHEARRLARLPSGATIAVYEMPLGPSTYAPWARPEEWASGFAAADRPSWNLTQAKTVWEQNLTIALRWMLPLLGATLALRLLSRRPRGSPAKSSVEWPLVAVGAAGVLAFLVVHAEARLLAPSALLLLFAAWPADRGAMPAQAPRRLLQAAFVGALVINLAVDLVGAAKRAREQAASERGLRDHLEEGAVRRVQRNVVLVGPFGPWVAVLWEYHLRVHAQIGEQAGAQLAALPPDQRLWWIRDQFGRSIVGVADATVRIEGRYTRSERRFTSF